MKKIDWQLAIVLCLCFGWIGGLCIIWPLATILYVILYRILGEVYSLNIVPPEQINSTLSIISSIFLSCLIIFQIVKQICEEYNVWYTVTLGRKR